MIERVQKMIKGRSATYTYWDELNPEIPVGILKRIRARYVKRRVDGPVQESKRRLFPNLFDPTKRRDFRVKVSGNRKWIMLGVAVIAICGTVVYLSISGGFMNLISP